MSHRIFIVSGGTGGHIIPARCLASFMHSEKLEPIFLGDEKIKNYTKQSDKFKSITISSSQIKKNILFMLLACIKIFWGFLQSIYLLLTKRPKVVVAFGGYATFPVLLACFFTKTRIVLHEQNSYLGKVNRIFAKKACKIATSFNDTRGIPNGCEEKITFTGNPIREQIIALHDIEYELPAKEKIVLVPDNRMGYDVLLSSDFAKDSEGAAEKGIFKILVIGGSGGAKIFSDILPKAFFNLAESNKSSIQIIQQCRKDLLLDTFASYKSYNLNIIINSFFHNMPELIKEAHLIIGRSGSSSIFEFCAAKKPMILVPFANSADDHQEYNARYFEKMGAAIVVRENDFTISRIGELLKNLINNELMLKNMSDKAAKLAVPLATQNLANVIYAQIK